jgi:ribosomal protein L37AE/L43A
MYSEYLDKVLNEGKKKWSGDVETKWKAPDGFFEKSAIKIAHGLKRHHKDLKAAMGSLSFYINRAGKNLSADDKDRLENAKIKLRSLYESAGNEERQLNEFHAKGNECDNCGKSLSDDDFKGSGSWSYDCPGCGFKYRHGSRTPNEQVAKFNGEEQLDEEKTFSPKLLKKFKALKNMIGKDIPDEKILYAKDAEDLESAINKLMIAIG